MCGALGGNKKAAAKALRKPLKSADGRGSELRTINASIRF